MDSTLIITKSGNKFAKDRNDWRWMLPETKPALVSLFKKGYKIVIFTNQAGAEKSKEKATALTGKILDLAKNIGIPLMVFMGSLYYQYVVVSRLSYPDF
jgi:bifunctional polynucleotide phosphatase/kinase